MNMESIRAESRDGEMRHCSDMTPVYYAKCTYAWPEFFDKGAFVYSEVRVCQHAEKLEAATREEAEAAVQEMNTGDTVCPECGQKHKFKVYTQMEILEENRMVRDIMNNIDHSR